MTTGIEEFARLLPYLSKAETEDLLLYLKVKLVMNKAHRGRYKPPTAEQWDRMSYVGKWTLYWSSFWWATLADINRKISEVKLPWFP